MVLITVLTDFGLADTYVGQLKGAVLAVAPRATLVDLTHAVAAQDVEGGAFLLWSAVEAFPAGTIHLAVVDPGVGSTRGAIALRSARGDILLGPDNGLLVPAADRLGGTVAAVELTDAAYWRPGRSNTFHGRDVFAPVAGHLAAGVPFERVGRPLARPLRPFSRPEPDYPRGRVVHVDVYGNLVTNIPADALPARFRVRIGHDLAAQATHYAEAAPGALLALVGSAGLLEIAARDGSAAARTGATRGTPVLVEESL